MTNDDNKPVTNFLKLYLNLTAETVGRAHTAQI